MSIPYERRDTVLETANQMRQALSQAQRRILGELENAGWELGFVRRNQLPAPLMFIYDSAGDQFSVIEADGSLGETSAYIIRH